MSRLLKKSFTETIDNSFNIESSYTLSLNTSAQGMINSSADTDYFRVDLLRGQTYQFGLIGTGINFISDPILRLRNSQGTLLSSNDDSGVGYSSLLSFRPSQTGTYYLDVRDLNDSIGQYGLSFSLGTKASFDLSMAGAATFIDSTSWSDLGTSASVTYGFRSLGLNSENVSTFSRLSPSQMIAVDKALNLWSEVANISFINPNPDGYTNNASILFGNYSDPFDGAGAYAYYPGDTSSSAVDGDVWLNLANGIDTSINIGDWSFETILHEIGHAIGLSHPGDYNAGPKQKITYSNSAQFLQDSNQYSVMSYFIGSNTGQFVSSSVKTPMLLDIYQLQLLYGVNWSTRSSDSIYGFNNTESDIFSFSLGDIPFFCIWDGGGNDNLNCSAYSVDQIINLNDASFSSVGGGVNNISIAYGVIIEKAEGGIGNDLIEGNDVDNYLYAHAGNDTLNGGLGDDTMAGGAGSDIYVVDSASDVVTETDSVVPTGGVDLIQSSVSYTAPTNVENITLLGTSHINATGNSLNNTLTGNSGNNILNGGLGNDTLIGGLGNDTYVIDHTRDVVTELAASGTDTIETTLNTYSLAATLLANIEHLTFIGSGNASLTGNILANTLTGSTGNDTITGGAGTDNMNGGDGNDLFMIGLATDYTASETINGGDGIDEIRLSMTAAGTVTLSSNITNIENVTIGTGTGALAVSTGTRAINVDAASVGNALNITGNAGANSLTGTNYDDTLNGNAGNDSLNGGQGNDTLNGGLGLDRLTGGSGNDIFLFNTALNATTNRDTITDFNHTNDTIHLAKSIMSALGTLGTLNAADFKISTGATGVGSIPSFDVSDRIIYNQTTGGLFYDADGSGSSAAVQIALIGIINDIDHTDFMIV